MTMSDQNNADNWRLEESGDTSGRWRLEETEQNQLSPWDLQEDYYEDAGWQPVEYARSGRSQGGGWVLPTLVGLALLAVVAYGVWIGLTYLPAGTIGSLIGTDNLLTPVPTVASVASNDVEETPVVAQEATTEPTATATTAPAVVPTEEPIVAPTVALVEERFATITSQYGVNARPNPAVEGDPLEILSDGDEYLVVDEIDEWLQIALPSRQLAWISSDPEFVNVRSETMELARANQFRTQVGAPALAGGEADLTQPAAGETEPITTTVALTDTILPTPTAVAQATTPTPSVDTGEQTVSGAVTIAAGLNARTEPSTTGELVALLPDATVLELNARTADNAWLRTVLSDTTSVWVFAEFITVDGDINTLPVIEFPGISAQESTPITGTISTSETVTETGTADPVATETPVPQSEPSGAVDATASVNTLLGTAVRAAPDAGADALDTAIYDYVLTVIGRSADNDWIQVDLGDQQGWVLASAVDLSVDIATLPVTTP